MKWLPDNPREWYLIAGLFVYLATDIWLSRRRSKKYREERKRLIEEFEAEQKRRRNEKPE